MCDLLETMNTLVHGSPSPATHSKIAHFLSFNAAEFRPCAWYAVCGDYDTAVEKVLAASRQTNAWGEFVAAWDVLYTAIKYGCCDTQRTHGRWMVTQTPADGPWGGRAICAPTLDPQSRVRRSYASQGECQMALQLLDPQEPAVATTSSVVCGAMGCDERVSWAPKPTR